MTTNNALDDKKRLPEHTQRLDWMAIAPDVLKAMVRLDTATGQGVEHFYTAKEIAAIELTRTVSGHYTPAT